MATPKCCASTPIREQRSTCACGSVEGISRPVSGCADGAASQAADARSAAGQSMPGQHERWITGHIGTAIGDVPQISTVLAFADVLGSWKCRWSIGRMDYRVEPGIYGVGHPDSRSPVLVTANYKMTFDRVRMELAGVDAWLLVLDSDGVNVWCAAGKGVFSTDELVRRIAAVQLSGIVSHRTVILPQLGATGVSARETVRRSGFHVVFGPVRAADIREFLQNGMKASEAMRTVRFSFFDRIVLTPAELVGALKALIFTFGILFVLNAVGLGRYGLFDLYALTGAIVAGSVVAPALLPWIPGRAFSFKGALIGLLWTAAVLLMQGFPAAGFGWLKALAYLLFLPSVSAFMTMNFTGSSTFTSLSGVDREMKIALPLMLSLSAIGVILLLVDGVAVASGRIG